MIFLDLPTINGSGTTEQQLSEIRSYIYKNNEQINSALSNLTIDKIWEQTASAVSSANQSEDETPKILKQYQRIRDLIIKTADVVVQSDEKMEAVFNGSYLAKSQFGEYLRDTKLSIDGSSVGITELYTYHTNLQTDYTEYKQDVENYIKRGLLGEDNGTPIYGIEVGLLSSKITVDGQEIPTGNRLRTRMTPSEMSFFDGNTKVAHINSGAIYFPAAHITGGAITGGSISIGRDSNNQPVFSVDSNGVMNAKSGTFGGTLDASKVSISNSVKAAWNNISNNKITLSSTDLTFYDGNEIDFNLNSKAITFYKRNTVDDVMAKFMRDTFSGAAQNDSHWGMKLKLRRAYAEYLSIEEYDDPGQSKKALVFVPNSGETVISPPSPYDNPGLYINTNLRIWNRNQVKFVSPPAPTTIKIAAEQIWGAVDAQNTDVYIDITEGIITRISTTA